MKTKVDFILPAYQKASTIDRSARRLLDFFDIHRNFDFRAIYVLDGPDPVCEKALFELADDRITVLNLPENRGKGAAIVAGLPSLAGHVVVVLDADLDIHPNGAIIGVNQVLSNKGVGCAYGSKLHPDSKVNYPTSRKVLSRGFRALIRTLFEIDVEDTQTGLKVFQTGVLIHAAQFCREDRFLFDIELLAHIGRLGYRLDPIPVSIDYQFDSTINLLEVVRMLADCLILSVRFRRSTTEKSLVS